MQKLLPEEVLEDFDLAQEAAFTAIREGGADVRAASDDPDILNRLGEMLQIMSRSRKFFAPK